MKGLVMAFILSALAACQPHAVVEWEHGLKTDRVTATRYNNPQMGYNIGFVFPKNPNDCDRAELDDFMHLHNGGVYQSGGYSGAVMYVVFKDVKDKESANKKLREILPSLSRLIQDLGNGKKVTVAKPASDKPEKKWPDTDPPDKTDRYWEFNNNLNSNGTEYKKSEVSPGKWQWVIDVKAMTMKAQEAKARSDLYWALRSRVLSEEEMKRVADLGLYLIIQENVSFNEVEKQKELNEALLQQFRLRAAADAKNK